MRVIVWVSDASRERAQTEGFEVAISESFFEQCDVVSIHSRLDESIWSSITLNDLSTMKTTAVLVKTSRAELFEANALIAKLNRGRPRITEIDVLKSALILQDHALLRVDNCIFAPRIGYVEQDRDKLHFSAAFDNVTNFIRGTPTKIVNPGALHLRR